MSSVTTDIIIITHTAIKHQKAKLIAFLFYVDNTNCYNTELEVKQKKKII